MTDHICQECGAINEDAEYDVHEEYALGEISMQTVTTNATAPIVLRRTTVFACVACGNEVELSVTDEETGEHAVCNEDCGYDMTMKVLRYNMEEKINDK